MLHITVVYILLFDHHQYYLLFGEHSANTHMCSEFNFVELVLSFGLYIGPGASAQVSRLHIRCFTH